MTTMLAAVYHGPNDLRVESVPVPEIGPDELLLRVRDADFRRFQVEKLAEEREHDRQRLLLHGGCDWSARKFWLDFRSG